MDSALDFDLLAEYLLEDVGAGGFDFSSHAVSPPTIDPLKNQQAFSALPQDPGVVTPNGSTSFFVDPLSNVAAQLAQQQQPPAALPLPTGGDMAGELSQVQQMIATQQRVTNNPIAPVAVAAPRLPIQQRPQIRPLARPAPQNNMMAVLRQTAVARAPISAASLIQRTAMPKHGMPVPIAQQPPNKRPRVSAAPSSKGPSYSFASVSGVARSAAAAASPAEHAHALSATLGGNRQKSQAQLDRRRERNRILARRTRLRKKFFFESLQKDVEDLQRENAALKSIVRSRLKPDDARVLLEQCNANEMLPSAIHARDIEGMANSERAGAAGDHVGVQKLDKEDFSLIQSIQNSQQCFIITDPSLHDNPIVYASNDFLTLTGYSQEEVLGRNCRFLQGTETCPTKVEEIRKAVSVGEDVNVTFVNYTSDGEPFWNSLFIAALRDADNNIVNFIGVIVKVTGPEVGDSEYGKVLK
eukprot:CAMPEP_0172319714 /NCGR_PEP_ID=MMETSP1058-20130122/38497_1 /TAXON_ID=83371 /ORGANISM="Detonula confervacea, Strain CCMP 353" /LENGTH=469 /DNA_ID=CAMNT_0013034827 /DNA_START=277 /DNA_END=1686 /DNA_ORIENTATION=+